MTTAMTEAFKAAGVKMTLREAIWRLVKDNPGISSWTVASRVKHLTTPATAGVTLRYLEMRGAITCKKDRRMHNGKSRPICLYTAVGDTMEFLKPDIYAQRHRAAVQALEVIERATAEPQKAPETTAPQVQTEQPRAPGRHGVDLESLTLGQLRALYADLKEILK